jgi:arylsulfatase A-like enzyme
LATLADTGLAANTIVVFSSDHGETLGSHGVKPANKQVAWSESAQVPFLMRIPGVGGRVVETSLTTPDILPTLLGLTGVKIPGSVEGEDLSGLIRAGKDEDRASLYMGVSPFMTNVPEKFRKEYRAIRTSRHTYARNLDGPWLLFDDVKDPYQTNNLVGQPEQAGLVRELDAKLQARLKQIGDDFRPGSSYVAEWGYKLGPHGSVPYGAESADPQTPRRNPAVKPSTPEPNPAATDGK